jgi:photosystem II stability/assembly factor-like uncharacterized protein
MLARLALAVSLFGVVVGVVVISVVGCGGRSYSSPFVACSTPKRNFDLTGAQHGSPALLGVTLAGQRSIIYAEGKSGAVYSSRTRGATWKRFGRGVEGVPCELIALDVRRPAIMFAGNGDELARSADAGSHWTTLTLPDSARATGVAIQASGNRTAYAWGFGGGHGGLTPGPPPGGVFRSSDSGLTWEKIASYEPDAVALSPPNMLYVAAESGLYETTDGGSHWRLPSRGLPQPYGHADNYDLASIAPRDAAIALVDARSGRQMNRGTYWGQFTKIIFRTVNGGDRWEPSLRLLDVSDLMFAPDTSSVAYVVGAQANSSYTGTTRFHLFRTADAGKHWQAYTGRSQNGRLITRLLVDPSATNTLYAETQDNRLARSLDRGETWTLLPRLPDAGTR